MTVLPVFSNKLAVFFVLFAGVVVACGEDSASTAACRGDADCAAGERCVQGACALPACGCVQTGPTVCGEDGQDYLSACHAACAGVQIVAEGACTRSCTSELDCDPGERCQLPSACTPGCESCDDCMGECVVPDCGCSSIEDWVCGEDGVTYLNACVARCAGVALSGNGPCPHCPPLVCELDCEAGYQLDANGCELCACMAQSCSSDLDCSPDAICQASCEDCPSYCVAANHLCACDDEIDWVCGSDGHSYRNDCTADCFGVVSYTRGVCAPHCPSLECTLHCSWGLATDEHGCPSCQCNVGPRTVCTDSRDCGVGQWCNPASCAPSCFECNDCHPACEALSCSCKPVWEPVCDVSGWTFGNACEAACAGSTGAKLGSCERDCFCPPDEDPVCGVDGVNYASECQAECEGVEIAYRGYCTP